ncbi:MAG: hypothetical protein LQ347_003845 [Umbilicaria vellea]|nr:MAG: hypothetical protein LQ347_003845 [Umbilicaria vellea]
MGDPFYCLPISLILKIMKYFLDLPSLDSLIHASPTAASTFEQFYTEITDAVITSTLSTPLQRLVRTILTVRTDDSIVKAQTEPPKALNDFLSSYVFGDAPIHPVSMTSAPLSVVRSFLDFASDIERLTQSFLETHLNRVNAINPSHLLNANFHFSYKPLDDHPEGRNYQPAKCGAPSWVEIYRVYRALWRIQLYYDLTPFIGSNDDGPRRVWGRLPSWELEEVECVHDYLQGIQSSDNYPSDFQLSQRLPTIQPTHPTQCWVAQAPPENNDTAFAWGQDPEAAHHPSPGYNFFHTACLHMPSSPLKHSSFRSFRYLGFGIWDMQKMAGLEMLNLPKKMNPPANGKWYVVGVDKRLSQDDLFFTWQSVKSAELDTLSAETAFFVEPQTVQAMTG